MGKYDISDIEKLYPNWHDKEFPLSYDDQKWIWENVPLPEEDEKKLKELKEQGKTESVRVKGSVNGTYRNRVGKRSAFTKQEVIAALKGCNYRTPPKEIALLLEQLFNSYESKQGHWLYVAQHWTPRAINRVLARILKQHQRGEVTIKNPSAYFTHLIKFRKPRRSFTSSNDTSKQHEI